MFRHRRLLILPALALSALTFAGCSASIGGGLDEAELEAQIAGGLGERFDTEFTVQCPDDIDPEAGGEFGCTAIDPEMTGIEIDVVQKDDEGNVRWELATLYAPFVAKSVPTSAGDEATCPDGIAIEAGENFTCTIVRASGETEEIEAVQSAGGNIRFTTPGAAPVPEPPPTAAAPASGASSSQLEGLEGQIATRLQQEFADTFAVECPENVRARVGYTFRCAAEGPEEGLRVEVEVTSEAGAVNWRGGTFYAPHIERQIEGEIRQQSNTSVEANCPSAQIVKRGNDFSCFLVLPEGGTQKVAVTAVDDDGTINFRTLPR